MDEFYGRVRENQPVKLVKEADRKFIYELVEDSRASLTNIAKRLRISKDVAHYSLTKLQESDVIRHISPVVNLKKLGYNTYHAFFVINDKRKEEFKEFLKNHKNTKVVIEYTSRWELEWILVAKDLHEFDDILTNITTEFADAIIEKNKFAIIKGYKSTTIAHKKDHIHKKTSIYSPDKKDLEILKLLHEDGRKSSYDIAEKIELSANAVRYRIKKMTDSEIIRYFTATINLNALGYHLYNVGFILKSLNTQDESRLKEFLRKERHIIRGVKVLGNWDIILTILADDIKHFHSTVKKIEDEFSNIIVSYDALIAYDELVYKYIPKVVFESK